MANRIKFSKKVFDKASYIKTINTSFNELGVESAEEAATPTLPSVQEFFDMYNDLFYQINEFGPSKSHEYLIKTSSDYIGAEKDNELIDLLQAEIASLRQQLLESQKQLANVATSVQDLIPEAPDPPPLPEPPPPPPPPPVPTTPVPPVATEETKKSLTNKVRVIMDFKKFPRSSINKRVSRLNLSKAYIKKIKKNKNL